MWKYLNRGISTPIAITIILILVIAVGGFTWWQYEEIKDFKVRHLGFEDLYDKEDDEITEKDSEIAGWETYRNDFYGIDENEVYSYEIKYPCDWLRNNKFVFVKKLPNNEIAALFFTIIDPRPEDSDTFFNLTERTFIIDDLELNLCENKEEIKVGKEKIIKCEWKKDIKISRKLKSFIKKYHVLDYDLGLEKIDYSWAGFVYNHSQGERLGAIHFCLISSSLNKEEKEKLYSIFDKMISSFKFID